MSRSSDAPTPRPWERGRPRPPGRGTESVRLGLTAGLPALVVLMLLLAGCGEPEWTPAGWRTIELPGAGADQPSPRGVAADREGGWIVLDTAGRVLRYDREGRPAGGWPMPESSVGRPENACVLPDGDVAVADTHYHRVVVFTPDGRVRRMFGEDGDGPGRFRYPVGICCDGGGRIVVGEYGGNDRIQVFTAEGVLVRAFGAFGSGPAELQRPQGLAWHEGRIYVADAMNNRIQVFRDDGTHERSLAAGELRFPYAVAVAGDGSLTVVEYSGNRLTRLAADGRVLGRAGSPGRGDGQLATPWGMARRADGVCWIADTGNRRVVQWGP